MAEAGYYATDNWRLSLGVSSLDGYNSVRFGTEYLFDGFDMPLAATTEIRVGQDGAILGTVGLRAYFGAPSKPLIRRHREDDPSDRSTSLYAAAGGNTLVGKRGSAGASGDDGAVMPILCDDPGPFGCPTPD